MRQDYQRVDFGPRNLPGGGEGAIVSGLSDMARGMSAIGQQLRSREEEARRVRAMSELNELKLQVNAGRVSATNHAQSNFMSETVLDDVKQMFEGALQEVYDSMDDLDPKIRGAVSQGLNNYVTDSWKSLSETTQTLRYQGIEVQKQNDMNDAIFLVAKDMDNLDLDELVSLVGGLVEGAEAMNDDSLERTSRHRIAENVIAKAMRDMDLDDSEFETLGDLLQTVSPGQGNWVQRIDQIKKDKERIAKQEQDQVRQRIINELRTEFSEDIFGLTTEGDILTEAMKRGYHEFFDDTYIEDEYYRIVEQYLKFYEKHKSDPIEGEKLVLSHPSIVPLYQAYLATDPDDQAEHREAYKRFAARARDMMDKNGVPFKDRAFPGLSDRLSGLSEKFNRVAPNEVLAEMVSIISSTDLTFAEVAMLLDDPKLGVVGSLMMANPTNPNLTGLVQGLQKFSSLDSLMFTLKSTGNIKGSFNNNLQEYPAFQAMVQNNHELAKAFTIAVYGGAFVDRNNIDDYYERVDDLSKSIFKNSINAINVHGSTVFIPPFKVDSTVERLSRYGLKTHPRDLDDLQSALERGIDVALGFYSEDLIRGGFIFDNNVWDQLRAWGQQATTDGAGLFVDLFTIPTLVGEGVVDPYNQPVGTGFRVIRERQEASLVDRIDIPKHIQGDARHEVIKPEQLLIRALRNRHWTVKNYGNDEFHFYWTSAAWDPKRDERSYGVEVQTTGTVIMTTNGKPVIMTTDELTSLGWIFSSQASETVQSIVEPYINTGEHFMNMLNESFRAQRDSGREYPSGHPWGLR